MDVRRSPGDLREACITEAMAIIEQDGLEKLSLREVARRLGVSHQAPYRHFPSRDHVLAEIVRRAYADFAAALRSTPVTENAAGDSLAMGFAYVQFALSHPLQYRLMFGGALPDPHQHSEMMHGARDAFDVLRHTLGRVFAARPQPLDQEAIDREAMFVWSSLHGLVSLLRSDALNTLELSQETRSGITMHALQRIGFAVGITPVIST